MLEASPGGKITTARIADTVGVSEAALYRHFPSKTRMYQALLDFAEDTLFSRVNQIMIDEKDPLERCRQILLLLLTFCERNPGITRILVGDVLTGEDGRLRDRTAQIFDRIETQLRQCLRLAELEQAQRTRIPVNSAANLLLSIVEGRIAQYVRTQFTRPPSANWTELWSVLSRDFLIPISILERTSD